jgi:hypothetical protein
MPSYTAHNHAKNCVKFPQSDHTQHTITLKTDLLSMLFWQNSGFSSNMPDE